MKLNLVDHQHHVHKSKARLDREDQKIILSTFAAHLNISCGSAHALVHNDL